MTNRIDKLDHDIQYLKTRFSEHAGDVGEEIHGLPQQGNAGFMPFGLFLKNQQLFEKRKWVTDLNIKDLAPGFYYCANMQGIPEDAEPQAMATIDVTLYEDNRKKIVYTQGFANLTWTKMIHTPGQASDGRGWYKTAQVMPLWDGAITNGTATLIRPRSDFKYLEYIYTGISSNPHSSKMLATMPYVGLDSINLPDIVEDKVVTITEMGLRFTDQKNFNIETNHTMYISPNSVEIDNEPSHVITLRGIIGYQ
ncbi:hypothetical protein [Latilactobacillus sakei]|uniref:hypothetical protein n=1 Tax=Latilactobacillus sakei TaxID=1599 RepID=UPI003F534492